MGDQDRYAAIFEKTTGPAWVARHRMTSAEYQSEFDTRTGQGYRLTQISGYSVGDQDRYAAIFEKTTGPAWVARHRMTSAEYQSEFDTRTGQGYRLTQISGYSVGDQDSICRNIREDHRTGMGCTPRDDIRRVPVGV